MITTRHPLVSVLVPTYARAEYAVKAVQSALAQDYQKIEVVALDDASPDHTATALAPYCADLRFRYVRHESNLGIGGNWRAGIETARGDFFCFLHDDDTLEPGFVSTLLAPLLADDTLAISFCDHWTMDGTGKRLPGDKATQRFGRDRLAGGRQSSDAFARAVLVEHAVPVGASLFRRATVSPHFIDERAKGAIDYWLLYQVLKTGANAHYTRQKLMNYRSHGSGMSAKSTLYMTEGHLFRLENILSDSAFRVFHAQVAQDRRANLTSYGIDLTGVGRRAEARRALWTAWCERSGWRTLAALLLSCLGNFGSALTKRLRANARRQLLGRAAS